MKTKTPKKIEFRMIRSCLRHFNMFAGVLLTAILCMAAFVTQAEAWWHENWQYRQKISLDTTPAGSDIKENLKEVPVLVRLHTANFNFNNCRDNGEDIRFVAADDLTQLKHHIERFDALDQVAFIWVNVNRLAGSTAQNDIYMYYGNEDAIGGQDAAGTYDPNYVAVFHFDEMDQMPLDVSSRKNNPSTFSGGQGFPGVIGNGLTFNGATDSVVLPASPSFDFLGGFTFSAWIRLTSPLEEGYIFSREKNDQSIIIAVHDTRLICRIRTGPDEEYITDESIDLPLSEWHHVAVTVSPQNRITLYLDGIETYFINFPTGIPAMETDIVIGASAKNEHFFMGDLDEMQISNAARSSDWIRTMYASQGRESTLLNVSPEQLGGGSGLPVFYLKTIFKNISLDGWVIIILLIIFSGLSWYVFLTKAFSIRLTEKENMEFKDQYGKLNSLLSQSLSQEREDQFQNSTLYSLYQTGYRNLKQLVGSSGSSQENACLTSKTMNSFKADLEEVYVVETKKLNSGLVLLTMAITGGPFLGLLGTVWGVMNTFAAMAEAGEASIMAIAPGVASALSTTVFGLIVAIPALFSYNYLLAKVKNIMTDMGIFIDQFAVKADEAYGEKS